MLLKIENDGPLIVSTNFWESDLERNGLCFLSLNARAFRLLLPKAMEPELKEFSSAKLAIVSTPRNPGRYAMEILFEDGTASPYCIHLSASQIDHLPTKEDVGRSDLELTIWTQPRRDKPHEALRRPAEYKTVPRLLR